MLFAQHLVCIFLFVTIVEVHRSSFFKVTTHTHTHTHTHTVVCLFVSFGSLVSDRCARCKYTDIHTKSNNNKKSTVFEFVCIPHSLHLYNHVKLALIWCACVCVCVLLIVC